MGRPTRPAFVVLLVMAVLHGTVLLTAAPPPDRDRRERLQLYFAGEWTKNKDDGSDCFRSRCLKILFDGTDDEFCVESNQIYLSVKYEIDRHDDAVDVFLVGPSSLGRGGESLPWREMERTKPIAKIEKSQICADTIVVTWYGLTTKEMRADRRYQYGDSTIPGEYFRVK